MWNGLDWEIQKYGQRVDERKIKINDKEVEEIIFFYQGSYYVEIWFNGIRMVFDFLGEYK